MVKSSQRQFLVKVSGIEGHFMTKTGGNVSADTSKVYDGGSITPDVLAGPAEVENITVSRAFDPQRDGSILKSLRQKVGRFTATITVTPTDRDLVALGNPVVYPNALLTGLSESDYDAASSDPATYELEFAIGSYT